jgi:hypothetical protein
MAEQRLGVHANADLKHLRDGARRHSEDGRSDDGTGAGRVRQQCYNGGCEMTEMELRRLTPACIIAPACAPPGG